MSLAIGRNVFGDPANHGNLLPVADAEKLLNEWVLNPRLQLHMKQVAHLMKCYARDVKQLDDNRVWAWELAGLLHDADWDQWPDQHCKKIILELENRKIDPEVIHAIASHGPRHFGVQPFTDMDKMLYAFDELSGLIHAYSLMRPGGYIGMDVKGVKKRLKEKSFAANVSREEIMDACGRTGLSLDELTSFIISNQPTVQ